MENIMALNRIPDEMDTHRRQSTHLAPDAQADVIAALSRVLADTYSLYLKTQYYHWNVTGEQFYSLHLLFEKQYTSLAAAIDKLAERLRALDATAPGTFTAFQSLTCFEEDRQLPETWQQMVENLMFAHEHLVNCSKDAMDTADAAGDVATSDLMIARAGYHEKNHWMLRSTLDNKRH
jgi:starvation-inducible DNA-binding protein